MCKTYNNTQLKWLKKTKRKRKLHGHLMRKLFIINYGEESFAKIIYSWRKKKNIKWIFDIMAFYWIDKMLDSWIDSLEWGCLIKKSPFSHYYMVCWVLVTLARRLVENNGCSLALTASHRRDITSKTIKCSCLQFKRVSRTSSSLLSRKTGSVH